jgi:hypothetical protein
MAILKQNALFHGISGKLDNLVFRRVGGKTFVCRAPQKRSVKTKKQKEHEEHFKQAVAFAKNVMAEPELKKYYQQFAKRLKCATPYAAAIKDFLKRPEIKNVCADHYYGRRGGIIIVTPGDPAKFHVVEITITTPEGEELESGLAQSDAAEAEFCYTATKDNYSPNGSIITVTLTDTPGHCVEGECTYMTND